ncbi:hypothetical protein N8H22_07020 [Stutzerimonas stutzeri]|uniref:hypothetical protein n=1 Tax=Stutzerimonas sp. S1 TaxID=3030652 RepID=UPI0022254402|nr:hypothetical protein [Stutzerimonas sp. S1]MCW3148357.1 hypothetical protein [Stutzerimonas sp. S1]
MKSERKSIIYLHERAPDVALESLNRLTGLAFSSWPESLAGSCERRDEPAVLAIEKVRVLGKVTR